MKSTSVTQDSVEPEISQKPIATVTSHGYENDLLTRLIFLKREFRGSKSEFSAVSIKCVSDSREDEYNTTVIRGGAHSLIAMAKGNVDFFNDTGGYGFIETDDADDDVFFHMEDVGGPDLEEGTEIEFDIEQAPKGPRATNVTRL